MRNTVLLALTSLAFATTAAAQTAQSTPTTLPLTVDEAVRMAVDHNLDLGAERLNPQISDLKVGAAAGAFTPSFNTGVQRNNQLQPPTNFLVPTATRSDAVTSTVGLAQRLPHFGTLYSASWNAVHTDSNSVLNSYNPLVQSGLSLNLSQPLIRDRSIDSPRQQLATSRINRDIAGTRLQETLVHTTANVKSAYWNLVAAIANVGSRRTALDLAQELVRVNSVKVNVGQSPTLDLVSAQAEVASDQEALIIAETAVKEAEDQLRMLIYDPTDRAVWNVTIQPIDPPPLATVNPDIDAAVTSALRDRADLLRARKDIDNSAVNVKGAGNSRLPDVRLNLGYTASGLGGTQVQRTGGFPGTVTGAGPVTGFSSVLNQLFTSNYPTWSAGVSVSYPIGQSSEDANYARTQLEARQSTERLKSAEARVIQQIRTAGRKIQMNAQRMQTTRLASELAEQRLDAEQKRFEVGMSTNFLVIQAQRDLAQAKQSQLAATLAYVLSQVDFEALQQAGPQGVLAGGSADQGQASATPAGGATAAQLGATSAVVSGARVLGF